MRDCLLELFNYDPATGLFTNKHSRGRARIGARAGSPSGHGYRKIAIDYGKYYEHHLARLYVYDEWPSEIDHVDGDGSNNAIGDLRVATRAQNNFNSVRAAGRSGLNGAYREFRGQSWFSKIQVKGQTIRLGTFNTPEEAHAAYLKAIKIFAGEFAFRNRKPQPLVTESI